MTLNIRADNRLQQLATLSRRKGLALAKQLRYNLRPAGSPRGLFLFGSGRSGTDIAASCLAQSLDVKLINEDNPLAFDNWRLKDLDTVDRAVRESGAPVVLLKPIVETLRAPELLARFEESAVLFVFREYNDAINSMIRFFGANHVKAVNAWVREDFARFPQLPEKECEFIRHCWHSNLSVADACGIYWLVYNSAFFYLGLDSDPRVHLSSYEELIGAPEQSLTAICQFAGLEYKPRMTRFIYNNSLKRNIPPPLSADLEERCAQVWHRLCARQRKPEAGPAPVPEQLESA